MTRETCLVLGGSGFLGREAVPALAESFHVIATSMRQQDACWRRVDLRDEASLRALLNEVQPSAVALLAAYRDPDFCEEHPEEARRLNVEPARVLSACLPATSRLLFVSTDYVFDGRHPPYAEDAVRNPLSVYGHTKAQAEDFILSHPRGLVVRVPLLMGWTNDPAWSGFLSHLVADVSSRVPVVLDDVLKRYPVWTRDLGMAMRMLLEKNATGIFHYSTSEPLTRFTAARAMAELMGCPADHLQPSHTVVARKAVRPPDARLTTQRWSAQDLPALHTFQEVARAFLAWRMAKKESSC